MLIRTVSAYGMLSSGFVMHVFEYLMARMCSLFRYSVFEKVYASRENVRIWVHRIVPYPPMKVSIAVDDMVIGYMYGLLWKLDIISSTMYTSR